MKKFIDFLKEINLEIFGKPSLISVDFKKISYKLLIKLHSSVY